MFVRIQRRVGDSAESYTKVEGRPGVQSFLQLNFYQPYLGNGSEQFAKYFLAPFQMVKKVHMHSLYVVH